MSHRYLDMFWDLRREVKGAPLVVLLALAEYTDRDTGQCWPSISALAEMTRISEQEVQRHLTTLRDMDIIMIEQDESPVTERSACYTILWPDTNATPKVEG